jgi:transcription elongation factor GreA
VKLIGLDPEGEEVFRIVPEREANAPENKISVNSPLARALEGAEAGDKVKFCPPVGEVELTILEVGRL